MRASSPLSRVWAKPAATRRDGIQELGLAMSMIQSTTNQISPANERVYHQRNLIGDWKGEWLTSHQAVEFKVINIRGAKAQVEYTHNGRTERGLADVNGALITFGNVSIGTRNGQRAVLEFSSGTAKMSAVLDKQDTSADQNKLVGLWGGFSRTNGQSAYFQVLSVDGRDAQVSYTVNGASHKGTGTVYKNTVMFGQAQITSDDGKSGQVVFQSKHQTFSVPVTKYQAPSTSSSVNRLA